MNHHLVKVALIVVVSGCAVRFSQRSPWDIQQIQALSNQLEHFKSLAQLNAEEAQRLREGKALLDRRLSSEIASDEVSVGFDERGLVVRVLDRVLFDSGKAAVRSETQEVLGKVAGILTQELLEQPISVEGHTDDVPITRSAWKDNWELSLARARAVLTVLVNQGVAPNRVSAAGYGEYRPVASNETDGGRQQNRRVEIVVLPTRSAQAGAGTPPGTSVSSASSTFTK
ncbi:MAG: OmpA family protein [Candidatus Omnitrophica bacterium]|nr:OmpA family protein [Candidatus Omnitrophota bacterium]